MSIVFRHLVHADPFVANSAACLAASKAAAHKAPLVAHIFPCPCRKVYPTGAKPRILIERGGAVEAVGVKLNFARVVTSPLATLTMPANLGGTPGQAIADSATSSILDTLRQARLSDIVVVDLGLGGEWWETRLLVLLAGAVRLRHPELVVFTATDGGIQHAFQGWARPDDLFPLLLSADQRYETSSWEAIAAVSQWSLEPPPSPPEPTISPIVFHGLAACRT
jgi:hypothetical protein